jgi:hypothetical protein
MTLLKLALPPLETGTSAAGRYAVGGRERTARSGCASGETARGCYTTLDETPNFGDIIWGGVAKGRVEGWLVVTGGGNAGLGANYKFARHEIMRPEMLRLNAISSNLVDAIEFNVDLSKWSCRVNLQPYR